MRGFVAKLVSLRLVRNVETPALLVLRRVCVTTLDSLQKGTYLSSSCGRPHEPCTSSFSFRARRPQPRQPCCREPTHATLVTNRCVEAVSRRRASPDLQFCETPVVIRRVECVYNTIWEREAEHVLI